MIDKIKHAIEEGKYIEAYNLLETYSASNPAYTDSVAILEASIYIGLDRLPEAFVCIQKGLKLNPVNYELYFMLGMIYETFSDCYKAYFCYENALFHCHHRTHNDDSSAIQTYFEEFKGKMNIPVPPQVSFIIPAFNGLEYTKTCIESIRAFCPPSSYEIICVDNASTDGSAEWLMGQGDIKYQLNEKNLGFAGGCNAGIRLANPDNDIFLLHNDTILTKNALFCLRMGLYEREDIGAAGAVSNHADGQKISETCGSVSEYLEYGSSHNIPIEDPLSCRTSLNDFALLIKRNAFERTGFLDELFYPGYFEDKDYSTRLISNNYRLALVKNCFILHFGAIGFSVLKEKNDPLWSTFFDNNYRYYIEKWNFRPDYSFGCRHAMIAHMNPDDKWKDICCLDIGCACGATLLEIQNLYPNARLYGIELDPNCAAFTSHFATVATGNIETMDFPFDTAFDYIFLGDVLEHLVEPGKLLKRLKPHLSKQGVVIASIPNILHFTAIGRILQGSFEYLDSGVLDRTHLRFFTKYDSIKLLMDSGYEITGFQKLDSMPADGSPINEFLDRLAELPGVVDKEQFFTIQYVYTARPTP